MYVKSPIWQEREESFKDQRWAWEESVRAEKRDKDAERERKRRFGVNAIISHWWWRWRRNVSFSLSASLSLFSALTLSSHAHLWSLKLSLKMRVSSNELFSTLMTRTCAIRMQPDVKNNLAWLQNFAFFKTRSYCCQQWRERPIQTAMVQANWVNNLAPLMLASGFYWLGSSGVALSTTWHSSHVRHTSSAAAWILGPLR